ncbi:ceramide phosphoethanolamine synthase-like [Malaya genurostris]|uniref:ceramide phosphoethanolamine synthase-like n=1 Tax=Malaya genurostris TaxID=325434 RepID=UPI0026F397E6|nr:ceramide phosphoethanolamine synthase-like [Malaya genurostris]
MAGYSSQINKLLLILIFGLFVFFIWMDVNLYIRIQDFPIRSTEIRLLNGSVAYMSTQPPTKPSATFSSPYPRAAGRYEDVAWVSCDLNPLCEVTVKAMILDHPNHYLFAPMVTIADDLSGISKGDLITPNMISFFHVFVAIAAARMINSNSLRNRRIGVVLFEFRTFLDDLDGHVARDKKHTHGERSDIGSVGFYIDGTCDALGVLALMAGIYFFFENYPPRGVYKQLQPIIPITKPKFMESSIAFIGDLARKEVVQKILCFGAIWALSAIGWCRHIDIYQDLLDRENVAPAQFLRQVSVFRSTGFFIICWLWRIFNLHALLHFLLLSIFCDKLWEFLRLIQYTGFVAIAIVIGVTEIHLHRIKNLIFNSSTD